MKRPRAQRDNELWESTRVYIGGGTHPRCAHLIPPYGSANDSWQPALCGVIPAHGGVWYGTGSQIEHERAAELPMCLNCERARRKK